MPVKIFTGTVVNSKYPSSLWEIYSKLSRFSCWGRAGHAVELRSIQSCSKRIRSACLARQAITGIWCFPLERTIKTIFSWPALWFMLQCMYLVILSVECFQKFECWGGTGIVTGFRPQWFICQYLCVSSTKTRIIRKLLLMMFSDKIWRNQQFHSYIPDIHWQSGRAHLP